MTHAAATDELIDGAANSWLKDTGTEWYMPYCRGQISKDKGFQFAARFRKTNAELDRKCFRMRIDLRPYTMVSHGLQGFPARPVISS